MKESSQLILGLLNTLPSDDHLYLSLIDRIWPRLVGERLASRSKPLAWQSGTLVVGVVSAEWKNHLSLLRDDLLQRLHARFRDSRVENLNFIIDSQLFATGADPGDGLREPPPERSGASPAAEEPVAQSECIRDPELQALFRRTVTRNLAAQGRPRAPKPPK